jgi:hypothetical protein
MPIQQGFRSMYSNGRLRHTLADDVEELHRLLIQSIQSSGASESEGQAHSISDSLGVSLR